MLAPWIIEEIHRREKERHSDNRGLLELELPLDTPDVDDADETPQTPTVREQAERGVAVFNL